MKNRVNLHPYAEYYGIYDVQTFSEISGIPKNILEPYWLCKVSYEGMKVMESNSAVLKKDPILNKIGQILSIPVDQLIEYSPKHEEFPPFSIATWVSN